MGAQAGLTAGPVCQCECIVWSMMDAELLRAAALPALDRAAVARAPPHHEGPRQRHGLPSRTG